MKNDNGLSTLGTALSQTPGPEALRDIVMAYCRRGPQGGASDSESGPSSSATAITIKQESQEHGDDMDMASSHEPLMAVKQENTRPDESYWEPDRNRLYPHLHAEGPLLVDCRDPTQSVTREFFAGRKLDIDYAHALDERLKREPVHRQRKFLSEAKYFAHRLINSDGRCQQARLRNLLSWPEQSIVADPQHPEGEIPDPAGLTVRARCRLAPFTIIGGYAAVLLRNAEDIAYEQHKTGAVRSVAYSWTSTPDKDGNTVVFSAYRYGNVLSLFNTNQMKGSAPLNAQGIGGGAGNNVSVMFINGFPVYVTLQTIEEGEEFLVDYGRGYNPLAVKQESLSFDAEGVIARHCQRPLIVQDDAGDEIRGYNAGGEYCRGQPQVRRTLILRQRTDETGNVWYDAFSYDGKRLAASPENSDNLLHALACAFAPKASVQRLAQRVADFKAIVAREKQQK